MLRSRFFNWFLAILFYFGFLMNYGYAKAGNSCQTPNKISGQCIDAQDCEPMTTLIGSQKTPFSAQQTKEIRSYTCGYRGNIAQICCPPVPIVLEPEIEDRVQPPDVTNHKNFNLLPQTCGHLDTEGKIVGGDDAGLTEFPWMALLMYRTAEKPQDYLCGGTIINKNYILTAAHCVTLLPSTTKLISIHVGEHTISNETDCEIQDPEIKKCNPPVQVLTIEETIPHPRFGGKIKTLANDIALVRVSTINLEVENARPVCLPIGIARDRKFSAGWVAGWGIENTETRKKSNVLQKLRMPIADRATCENQYRHRMGDTFFLRNTQTCVGSVIGKDSCSGDSGGSLVVATLLGYNSVLVQQGIVSFGPRDCGSDVPGIYTQVKYYMDWILDNMKP